VDSQFDPAVTWDDIAWVRENWPGRIVLKGVLDVEDARQAAAVGADGIVVSNHGGRQLDGVEAEHRRPAAHRRCRRRSPRPADGRRRAQRP
jgi:L-lactate dehydrogenase (cytochrome)